MLDLTYYGSKSRAGFRNRIRLGLLLNIKLYYIYILKVVNNLLAKPPTKIKGKPFDIKYVHIALCSYPTLTSSTYSERKL